MAFLNLSSLLNNNSSKNDGLDELSLDRGVIRSYLPAITFSDFQRKYVELSAHFIDNYYSRLARVQLEDIKKGADSAIYQIAKSYIENQLKKNPTNKAIKALIELAYPYINMDTCIRVEFLQDGSWEEKALDKEWLNGKDFIKFGHAKQVLNEVVVPYIREHMNPRIAFTEYDRRVADEFVSSMNNMWERMSNNLLIEFYGLPVSCADDYPNTMMTYMMPTSDENGIYIGDKNVAHSRYWRTIDSVSFLKYRLDKFQWIDRDFLSVEDCAGILPTDLCSRIMKLNFTQDFSKEFTELSDYIKGNFNKLGKKDEYTNEELLSILDLSGFDGILSEWISYVKPKNTDENIHQAEIIADRLKWRDRIDVGRVFYKIKSNQKSPNNKDDFELRSSICEIPSFGGVKVSVSNGDVSISSESIELVANGVIKSKMIEGSENVTKHLIRFESSRYNIPISFISAMYGLNREFGGEYEDLCMPASSCISSCIVSVEDSNPDDYSKYYTGEKKLSINYGVLDGDEIESVKKVFSSFR
jgi:hypothetical protein